MAPNPKVFLVSGMDIDIDTVKAATEKLGGARVQSSGEYDSTVTHLVMSKLQKKNEKLLCCTAGGKWVLHQNYVTDSQKVSSSFYLGLAGGLCFTVSSLPRPAGGCQSRTTSGGTTSSPRMRRSSNWRPPPGSGGCRREDLSRA